jgi:hypothetical protein
VIRASFWLAHTDAGTNLRSSPCLQEGGAAQVEVQDPYQNEPERHPALIVRSAKPFNAETPRVS